MSCGSRYRDMIERLLANSVLDEASGCWIWIGANTCRYGQLTIRVKGRAVKRWAHRVSYSTFRLDEEPIPEGMTVDHLCSVTLCINPMHMELVTREENNRRRDERAVFGSRNVLAGAD